jgi:hypothetical protein
VLVVVALLALGAYTFSEFMLVEAEATRAYGREVQARAAADSGIVMAASLLEKRYVENPPNVHSNPQYFQGVLVRDSTNAGRRCRFSVLSAAEQDTSNRTVRYGLCDESAKLNLNTMAAWLTASTITSSQAETMLTNLSPDVTIGIADAILDWMDPDQTPMQNGAEMEHYQGLTPPYPTKDNQLDSLGELLLVRDITPTILFGEDTNHNGILDPNENDGAATLPLDNADGTLQRGLSQFLTVYSRENNLRPDASPRININQPDLNALYQALTGVFDEKTATFMVAYRQFGPAGGAGGGSGSGGSGSGGGSGGSGGSSGGGGSGGGGGGSGGGGSGGMSGGSSGGGGAGKSGGGGGGMSSGGGASGGGASGGGRSGSSSGGGAGGSSGGGGSSSSPSSPLPSAGQTQVAGMIVTNGGTYQVKSLYELFGASSRPTINGVSQTLPSPWTTSTGDLQANAPKLLSNLTLTDQPYIDGRININLAPREVLLGIPNMTPSLADSIVGSQIKPSTGQSTSSDEPADRLTTAWLVTSGLLSVNTLEQLDPYITARGDVFHMQSVGYFDGGGPMARVDALIDATQIPPQVVFLRDLTELGRSSSGQLLMPGSR